MASLNDENQPGFQIAPMVDVVFVLLLFFMACAANQDHELELAISVAQRSPQVTEISPIFVDLDAEGDVKVNGQFYSSSEQDPRLGAFQKMLTASVEVSPEDPVIIRPAGDVRHARLMQVLAACRAAGVKKVSFAG
jgi:biopolymer transport protein ExbD